MRVPDSGPALPLDTLVESYKQRVRDAINRYANGVLEPALLEIVVITIVGELADELYPNTSIVLEAAYRRGRRDAAGTLAAEHELEPRPSPAALFGVDG